MNYLAQKLLLALQWSNESIVALVPEVSKNLSKVEVMFGPREQIGNVPIMPAEESYKGVNNDGRNSGISMT